MHHNGVSDQTDLSKQTSYPLMYALIEALAVEPEPKHLNT